jgi:integrase
VIGLVREIPKKRQALVLLEERLRSINQGKHRPNSVLTFREFALEKWEPAILPTLKHTTQRDYRSLLRRHLLPAFESTRLIDFQRADVQLFLSQKGKQFAPKTVHHLRVLLSRILGLAVDWGYMSENLARGTKLPKPVSSTERDFLTLDKVRILVAGLPEPARTITVLAVLTGLRRSEIFGLRWKRIDFGRRLILIRERLYQGVYDTPKGRSARSMPMGDAVFSMLVAHRESSKWIGEDDPVFCGNKGQPLDPQEMLKDVVYPTCDRLGVPRTSWHVLRHTYSTYLDSLGVSAKTIQSLLGHSNIETTLNVYTHAVVEEQRKAMARLEGVLFPSVPNFVSGSELSH